MGWPGPMTYRQCLAWETWLEQEMNNPGRLEFYLMRLMWETRYSALRTVPKAKIPSTIDTEQFKVKIVRKNMNESNPNAQNQQGSDQQQLSQSESIRAQDGIVRTEADKRRIYSQQQSALRIAELKALGVKVVDQHGNPV